MKAELGAVRWQRVNDEPFEYAVQQGPHGDEFVKLLDGSCLRRSAATPDVRAAALARRLCQLFDSGGESQRSVRARHASAIFQLLDSDAPEFLAEQKRCDADPVGYLEAAEGRVLANQNAPTRDGGEPESGGYRDAWLGELSHCNALKEENFSLTTTLAANSARVESLEAALRDHGAAVQMLMAQLIVNDAEHPGNVRIIDQRIPASVYDKALSAANILAALQQSPPQGETTPQRCVPCSGTGRYMGRFGHNDPDCPDCRGTGWEDGKFRIGATP